MLENLAQERHLTAWKILARDIEMPEIDVVVLVELPVSLDQVRNNVAGNVAITQPAQLRTHGEVTTAEVDN
jgi:hypothetical protein